MSENNDKEIAKIRTSFYLLFGAMMVFVLLTPHIIHGHILVPQKYAESAALFLGIVIGYFFYRFYRRKMDEIFKEKTLAEKRLVHSYGYIGKMNNIVDLVKRFGKVLSHNQDETKEKEIFMTLLSNMLISVARVDKGFIRFFNKENSKTIKEYHFSKNGDEFSVKLPNSILAKDKHINENNFIAILSGYENTIIKCVLCMPKIENIDEQLLQSLVTQTHLLFLSMHKDGKK